MAGSLSAEKCVVFLIRDHTVVVLIIQVVEDRTPESTAGLFSSTSYCSLYARSTGNEEQYFRGLIDRIKQAAGDEAVKIQLDFTGGIGIL